MTGMAGAEPTVSVVIIFLDAARFLDEAIGSVRAQSLGDWELILVDDGSTDGSTDIAADAARADPDRIRAIAHPGRVNRGTSASRELGLRAACGTLLLYLDADDILFVDALATLHEALDRHPGTDAALAATLFWNWHPEFRLRRDTRQDLRRWIGVHRPPQLLTEMTRDEYMHPANCSSLFRRQVLIDLGGFEAEFTGMYEDTVLLAKVLLERQVVMIDACVSAYRMHPSSQCHRAAAAGTYDSRQPNRDRARYLRWLRTYVRRRGVRNVALRVVIERELIRYDVKPVNWIARKVRGEVRRARRLALASLRTASGRRPAPPAVPAREDREPDTAHAIEALARALSAAGIPDEADALRRRLEARSAA